MTVVLALIIWPGYSGSAPDNVLLPADYSDFPSHRYDSVEQRPESVDASCFLMEETVA